MTSMHISQAREILDRHELIDLVFWTKEGKIIRVPDAVPLKYDREAGTRRIKCKSSGQIRCMRDVLIHSINQIEVYL